MPIGIRGKWAQIYQQVHLLTEIVPQYDRAFGFLCTEQICIIILKKNYFNTNHPGLQPGYIKKITKGDMR